MTTAGEKDLYKRSQFKLIVYKKTQKNERKKHQLVGSVQLCEDRGRYIHTLRKVDWVWRRRAEGHTYDRDRGISQNRPASVL